MQSIVNCNLCGVTCHQNGGIQTLLWENLNAVIANNGVSNMNFNGFMTNGAHAKWNVVRKIYSNGDPIVPMDDCKHSCVLHGPGILKRSIIKYIKPSIVVSTQANV